MSFFLPKNELHQQQRDEIKKKKSISLPLSPSFYHLRPVFISIWQVWWTEHKYDFFLCRIISIVIDMHEFDNTSQQVFCVSRIGQSIGIETISNWREMHSKHMKWNHKIEITHFTFSNCIVLFADGRDARECVLCNQSTIVKSVNHDDKMIEHFAFKFYAYL